MRNYSICFCRAITFLYIWNILLHACASICTSIGTNVNIIKIKMSSMHKDKQVERKEEYSRKSWNFHGFSSSLKWMYIFYIYIINAYWPHCNVKIFNLNWSTIVFQPNFVLKINWKQTDGAAPIYLIYFSIFSIQQWLSFMFFIKKNFF